MGKYQLTIKRKAQAQRFRMKTFMGRQWQKERLAKLRQQFRKNKKSIEVRGRKAVSLFVSE